MCKVYRNGEIAEVAINDIVVGDAILLQSGDKVPADGIIIDGDIKADQSVLNGESRAAKKIAVPEGWKDTDESLNFDNEHKVFRGSVVCSGNAVMEVTVVGDKSVYGKIASELQTDEMCIRDSAYTASLGRNPTLADMGSTFLAALVVPLEINGGHENFVLSAQIGDGCICAIDRNAGHENCFRLLGEADSGAYSGETDFLSEKNVSEGAIARRTRISRGKSDIIMLMSDGVADDYFPAQPQMKRLCLDLMLNGIIPVS